MSHAHPTYSPGDISTWERIGHARSDAQKIASCFEEYWLPRMWHGAPSALDLARTWIAVRAGELPLHCAHPAKPVYLSPETLPETDPIHWYSVNGYHLYDLEQAVEIALAIAHGTGAMPPDARSRYREYQARPRNPQQKRFTYVASRRFADIEFWQQLGHYYYQAMDIAKCYPEYWFRTGYPWDRAMKLATHCITCAAKHDPDSTWPKMDLAPPYDIDNRNPILRYRWHCDLQKATQQALEAAGVDATAICRKDAKRVRRYAKLPKQAEQLPDGAIYLGGTNLGCMVGLRNERPQDREWPQWGCLRLNPEADVPAHCCAIGDDQHAKRALLQMLMASVSKDRWLAYDTGRDLLAAIQGFRRRDDIHLLNPFDRRSTAWDIADDARTPEIAQLIPALLLSDDPSETEYAVEAQRALAAAAIESLHRKAPGKWSLLHLLTALQPQAIQTVLSEYPSTRSVYHNYLGQYPDDAAELLALLQAKLQAFYPVAAAWQHAKKRIGIRQWLKSRAVLLLGCDQPHQHLLAPLNRVLTLIVAKLLLSGTEQPADRTWMFCPDIARIGHLEPLPLLLAEGKKAQLTCYLGINSLAELHEHYGNQTLKILEQCGNVAVLRVTDANTAQWASDKIGTQRVILSIDERTPVRRPAVPPAELQALPLPDSTYALSGYLKCQSSPWCKTELLRETVETEELIPPPDRNCQDFVARPKHQCQFPEDAMAQLDAIGFEPRAVSASPDCVCEPHQHPTPPPQENTPLPKPAPQQTAELPLPKPTAPTPSPQQAPQAPRPPQGAKKSAPRPPVQESPPTEPEVSHTFNPDDFPRLEIR